MANILGTSGNNTLTGTADDDNIRGRGGNDTINGGAGNDFIQPDDLPPAIGNDTIDGGAGEDTLLLFGNFADYTITFSGSNILLTRNGVTETVTGVEVISFDDKLVRVVGVGSEYDTIQNAVDAANVTTFGDTILVAPGTYTEQVVVDGKSDITIMAVAGTTVTIQAPADVVETAVSSSNVIGSLSERELHGVLTVKNATNVQIANINIDGAGRGDTVDEGTAAGQAQFAGVVYRNASGSLTDVDVTGVRDSVLAGAQRGTGIIVDNDTTMSFTMTGGSISDYQKNAAAFNGADLTVTGVTVTGAGATGTIAQNGFLVTESTGTISGNTISGLGYTGAGVYAASIYLAGNENVTVTGNTVTGANITLTAANVIGVLITDFGIPNDGGTVSGNTFDHVDVGVAYYGETDTATITVGENTLTNPDTTDAFYGGLGVAILADPTAAPFNITGTTGDDLLAGGSGADTFVGLAGNDTYLNPDATDTITDASGNDTVLTSASYTLTAGLAIENLTSIGTGISLTGNELAQTITGDAGNNTLAGGGGTDTFLGGAGIDTLELAGSMADYTGAIVAGNLVLTHTVSGEAVTISGVEVLDFAMGADVRLAAGFAGSAYATIQAAVDAAETSGEIVLVGPGTYTEDVVIAGKAIELTGFGATGAEATTLNGQITISGVLDGAAKVSDVAINAAGKSYGIYVTASSTAFAGSVTVEAVSIANAGTNGFAYIRDGNGSTPTLGDTVGTIVLDEVAITGTAPTSTGSNGRGDILLFGYNQDLTLTDVTISSPGAQAQKAIQIRGIQDAGDVAGTGPFDPSGDVALTNVSVTGSYLNEMLAVYRIAEFDSFTFDNVSLTGSAVWGLVNFDSVGGTIDLSSGITGSNSHPSGLVSSLQGLASVDTFTATSGNDVLVGRDGGDALAGGDGTDTAVYTGTVADYSFTYATDANGIVTGFSSVTHIASGAIDTLTGIENVVIGATTLVGGAAVQVFDGATLVGTFTTIQAAVTAASAGNTVRIGAGTYDEQVTIDKSLTILGANATVDPTGAGPRGPETIIADTVGRDFMFLVAASDVTIKGLTFSGLAGGGTFEAITGWNGPGLFDYNETDRLVIENNIIENIGSVADYGYGIDLGSDGAGAFISSDIVVTHNVFQDMPNANGVIFYGNAYGDITDNVFRDVDNPIYIGNQWIATDGTDTTPTISGNDIETSGAGIVINNSFGDPTPFTVSANTISDGDGAAQNGTGIVIWSLAGTATVVVENNSVTGMATGVEVWNAAATITGGTLDGNAVGVLATDTTDFGAQNATVTIAGTTISNSTTAAVVASDTSGAGSVPQVNFDAGTPPVLIGNAADAIVTGTEGGFNPTTFANPLIISGDAADNTLTGGVEGGTITGGAGVDTLELAGAFADYTVAFGGGGELLLTDADGDVTTVTGVENLDFATGPSVRLVGLAGSEHITIQSAIDAAAAGDTVLVGPGTYAENLSITKTISLLSTGGENATTIVGSDASSLLGTIQIASGVNGVRIGDAGQGFTIEGINGNGAIEKAAVYIIGNNDGLVVEGNEIVAKGDAGLQSEFGGAVTNAVIDGNIFSGQTFVGPNPQSSATNTFSGQFDVGNDFPRQLVVLGNGGGTGASSSNNITFTNNTVSGTTGGISSATGQPFGNTLVTIDASDSTITDNTFTGTAATGSALRARRDGTDIEDNSFDASGTGSFTGVFIQNNTTGTFTGNTFTGSDGVANVFTGTPGDDVIGTGGGDDIITGGLGSDTIDGGAGSGDIAAFAGAPTEYSFTYATDAGGNVTGFQTVTHTATGAVDTLTGIEVLAFNNGATLLTAGAPVQVFSGTTLVGTFSTIQAAVNAAPNDATIRIAAGTYAEQVVIDGKTGLTLVESGGDVTIVMPAVFSTDVAGLGATPVVAVYNSTDVTLTGITVDGNRAFTGGPISFYIGIDINASTDVTVDGVTVTGTRSPEATDPLWNGTDLFGLQDGFSIYAYQSENVTIQNSTFQDSQKGHIVVQEVTGTVVIHNNDVIGVGADGRIAQNGIEIFDVPGGATVTNNDVTGISYTDNPAGGFDEFATTGIFLSNAPGSTVSGNTVTAPPASSDGTVEDANGRAIGIYVDDSDGTTVSNNTVTGLPGAEDHSGIAVVNSAEIVLETNTFTDLSVALATDNSTGPAGASLNGTPFVDFLTGGAGDETIDGLGSADTIDGAGGNDTLIGGAGSDTLIGGAGIDTIVLAGSFADYVPSFGTLGEFILTNPTTGEVETITGAEVLDFETGPDVRLVNVAGGGYATIQAAIDAAAAPGEVVFVGAGVYAENVTVNKHVNLLGLDDTLTVLNGSITITGSGADAANRTTVQGFGVTGGVTIGDADHVGLHNVSLASTGSYIVNINFAGEASDITITDAVFNGTGGQLGLRVSDQAAVTDLVVKDSVFNGGQYGIYLANDSAGSGDTVTGRFEGLTFNGQKTIDTQRSFAIYAEKLSDATLSDITVVAHGAPADALTRGINLNLKNGTFEDITLDGIAFSGFDVAQSPDTAYNPLFVANVTPTATLDGLVVTEVTAAKGAGATGNGLIVLDIFAQNPATPIQNVSLTDNTLSGLVKVQTSAYTSIDGNTITGDLQLIAVDQPAAPGNSLAGNTVSGQVTVIDYRTVTLPEGADDLVLVDGGVPPVDGNGNDGDNTITGNSGANTLAGGGGLDTFVGGLGNDAIDGGADSDVAIYAGNLADYAITYATSGGVVTGFASITNIATGEVDTLSSIETLRFADQDLTVDVTAPTATVTISDTALRIGETATVTVTFSEAVTGFTNDDVTAPNGTLDTFVTTDGGVTWTATFTPTADIEEASNAVSLANLSYTDIPGNAGAGADSETYAVDTKAPTATIALSDTALKAGETATVTVTFSEAVDGFSNADIMVENGSVDTFTTSDGGVTWTATFSPTADIEDTTNVVTLAADYTDLAGNAGSSAVSPNYAIDTDNPGVAINTIEGDDIVNTFEAVNGVQITGTSDVANGTLVAVSIDGGTAFNATVTNGTWTLTRPAPADGPHTISASVTDPAGNTTTIERMIVVDRAAPTITINTVEGDGLVNAVEVADGVLITGTTNAEDGQEVTVFVNDAEVLSAIASGGMWTVTSTASTDGAYSVRATVADSAGNPSNEALGSFTIDTVPPTVELLASGVEGGDLDIDGVEVRDGVDLTGTVEAGATVVVNGEIATVTGTTWTVTIPIPPEGGMIPVTVVATDAAGNEATTSLTLDTAELGVTEFDDILVGTTDPDTINLLGGDDTYFGDAGGDDITGGAGADDLDGGEGDDTFRAVAGDIVAGEAIEGGLGFDTLALGAGAHSLVGVGVSGIEAITLAAGATPNTLTLGSADQALLVTAAPGDDDTVIFDGFLNYATQVLPLAAVGVEHVQFTNANGTNTVNFVNGVLDSLVIDYLASNTQFEQATQIFDPVTGRAVSAETIFDSGLIQTEFFNATTGQRTGIERVDGGDDFIWETQTDSFVNGVLATRTQENDDGTGLFQEFGTGGATTRTVNTQVDGDTYDILFNATGTQVVQTITTDVSNTASYQSITNDFTAGVFNRTTTVLDNGVVTQTNFDPATGKRTTYEQFDDANLFTYDSLITTYAADGSTIVSTVVTQDNGSRSHYSGAGGATLTGGTANDSMTGAAGAADVFVFAPGGGNDFIANFQNGVDDLDLQAFNFTDFAQVEAIATGGTGFTTLRFSDGGVLTINGLSRVDLDADDVII